MNKILIFTQWYLPALKAGGPVKSCYDLVNNLKSDFKFFVVTGAYDLGSREKLNISYYDQWITEEERVQIYYNSKLGYSYKLFKDLLQTINPDLIYLNSFFSFQYTQVPIHVNQLFGRKKVIIACRGMVKPSALEIKKTKKNIFINLIKWVGIPKNVFFHATNDIEKIELLKLLGNVNYFIADNFPGSAEVGASPILKEKGVANLIFIGRIHPIKNLHFILEFLHLIRGSILLHVIGAWENRPYLEKCQNLVDFLPSRIQVIFTKEISSAEVIHYINKSHALILPSQGENYGHAIVECLQQARPVLISNQTPWRNLEQFQAGWDLPLSSIDSWAEKVQIVTDWDQNQFDKYSNSAKSYIKSKLNIEQIRETYKLMFS